MVFFSNLCFLESLSEELKELKKYLRNNILICFVHWIVLFWLPSFDQTLEKYDVNKRYSLLVSHIRALLFYYACIFFVWSPLTKCYNFIYFFWSGLRFRAKLKGKVQRFPTNSLSLWWDFYCLIFTVILDIHRGLVHNTCRYQNAQVP